MEEWDVITMSEAWLDKKKWERVKGRFPRGFKWGVQYVRKIE